MSSDDEDPGMKKPQVQYIIKAPKWRSVELLNLLRLLDYCHLEGRCTTEATRFGYTRGAPPRIRIDKNDRSSKTKYVSGLPANFYDAQWLEEQEPGWAKGGSGFVNEFVRPRKPIKLISPADLLKCVSSFRKLDRISFLFRTLKDRGYPRAQGPEWCRSIVQVDIFFVSNVSAFAGLSFAGLLLEYVNIDIYSKRIQFICSKP